MSVEHGTVESGNGLHNHHHHDDKAAVGHHSPTGAPTASGGQYGGQLNRGITPGGHAIDSSQPAFPVYHRRFANPAPLGLLAFAVTTFILSLLNVGAKGVAAPNIIIGSALGYGGLVQLIAGIWEFAAGNTFGATAFCSYGGFWISFGLTLWPSSGVVAAYTVDGAVTTDFDYALGFYLAAWFIFTFIMLIASLRSSAALVSVFFFLTLTFLLLFVGKLLPTHTAITTAGGAFGLVTAACAFYTGAAGLLTPDAGYLVLPVGDLSRKD
ncbi:uncharacterized protein L969DRAFT_49244 [Mixia osmundae IAM 14324]|uniref:uncharacterized protein n=1 Tax=Mixia osmundae (strain CBS 9802 / IAM 14324 / JCM 22182 / KY 12970) TaxID=764103 RepID=UPI0004A54A34|nr:uncharacterized protein L969DRAFT_49244 [Mixia osmundae IAM 14324]KEI39545.1 hypothetical protein L969DRAFT_49244 [Mixia osmundae IAM 14324]